MGPEKTMVISSSKGTKGPAIDFVAFTQAFASVHGGGHAPGAMSTTRS
jgi:hypothetical protein